MAKRVADIFNGVPDDEVIEANRKWHDGFEVDETWCRNALAMLRRATPRESNGEWVITGVFNEDWPEHQDGDLPHLEHYCRFPGDPKKYELHRTKPTFAEWLGMPVVVQEGAAHLDDARIAGLMVSSFKAWLDDAKDDEDWCGPLGKPRKGEYEPLPYSTLWFRSDTIGDAFLIASEERVREVLRENFAVDDQRKEYCLMVWSGVGSVLDGDDIFVPVYGDLVSMPVPGEMRQMSCSEIAAFICHREGLTPDGKPSRRIELACDIAELEFSDWRAAQTFKSK